MLGYAVRGSANRDVSSTKTGSEQNEKARRVKFQDCSKSTTVSNKVSNQGGIGGRQLAPGLLLVQQDGKGKLLNHSTFTRIISLNDLLGTATSKFNSNPEITKTIDCLDASPGSPIDDSVNKGSLNVSTGSTDSGLSSDGVRPTDQLTYLAQILGFKVGFHNFFFLDCRIISSQFFIKYFLEEGLFFIFGSLCVFKTCEAKKWVSTISVVQMT